MRLDNGILLFPAGATAACRHAAAILAKSGVAVVDHPTPEATHLLLDVPAFSPDGQLRGGGDIAQLLRMLPPDITVIGGNLVHPALEAHSALDLLQDSRYLADNAAITAQCALMAAAPLLDTTFADAPSLVIGWGRIGKCLARLLRGLGAEVTVAARKESDRAMLHALGYAAADTAHLGPRLDGFRIIWNTVPQLLLTQEQLPSGSGCLKIDLASQPGMAGDDVVIARGLPGKLAPAASGKLIAATILRKLEED